MKTAIVFALLVGLATATLRPFKFTVFGAADPAAYSSQQIDQLGYRYIPSYKSVLLSQEAYYDTKPSDNYPYPYTYPYRPVPNINSAYQPVLYSNSPSTSYFRPDLNEQYLNPVIAKQQYISQLYPHLRPQNLEYFSQFYASQLHPNLRPQILAQQLNPSFSSLTGRTYTNDLNNIRNGPVTVLVKSREDPTKLVAVLIEHGLESLGEHPYTSLLEAIDRIKTGLLFNPINIPDALQKILVSRYIIPSGIPLGQLANLALRALQTPFLLLDDDATLISEIKSSYQTIKLGSIEAKGGSVSVNVLPHFPEQPAVLPAQTGFQPLFAASSQSTVPVLTGSSVPSSAASAASVSSAASSASQQNPENFINQAAPSSFPTPSATSQGFDTNNKKATSSISTPSAVPQGVNANSNKATPSDFSASFPENVNNKVAALF